MHTVSHLKCLCGHTITDRTDFLPYKAYIRKDEETEKPVQLLAGALAQYWEAREHGTDADFIRSFSIQWGRGTGFGDWEIDRLMGSPLAEVLSALISMVWNDFERDMYECEECGRLWLQAGVQRWVSYAPEMADRHILQSDVFHLP